MALRGEMHYLTIGDSTYSIPVSGGSSVTITTDLTSGTKTATIGVDGQSYDLYAPTPNTGTITNVKTTAGAHTTIDVSSGAANFNIPTKTSHLTNDSGFITEDEKLKTITTSANTNYYAVLSTNHNVAETKYYDLNIKYNYTQGTSSEPGISLISLGNSVNTLPNSMKGQIKLYATQGSVTIDPGNVQNSSVLTLPNATGTVALTSDIPTKTSDLTNDNGYVTTDEKLATTSISADGVGYFFVLSSNSDSASTKYRSDGNLKHFLSSDGLNSYLLLGKSGYTKGNLRLYRTGSSSYTQLSPQSSSSGNITIDIPGESGTLALTSDIPTIPTSTGNVTTGITASTTATKTTLGTANSVIGVQSSTTTASKVTLGTAISIYGVKSGTNSTTTASKASGGNGSASNWVFEDVDCDDITNWVAGSGSFTQGSFTGGSIVVNNHVMSFTPATHGADSHSHIAPTLSYTAKTGSHVKSGGNGTAPTWSFTDVTVPIRADSATSIPNVTDATDVTVPIKDTSSTSIPNVSVTSATVSITDNGHTHSI